MQSPDPLDQLKKLAELRDAGILTPQEFQTKKADLLDCVGCLVPTRKPSQESEEGGARALPADAPNASQGPLGDTLAAQTRPAAEVSEEDLFGRVTAQDVQRAREQVELHAHRLQFFKQSQRDSRRRLAWMEARLRYTAFVRLVRSGAEKSGMGRGGWTLIGITAMVGLFLVATSASTLNAGALLWAAVLALLIGSPLFIHLLFFPGDDSVLRSERAGREEVERVSRQEEVDRQTATVARHALDQARMQYNRLSRVFQSRRNALYARDWRSLRGIPFEEFLKEVFEELGFVVEATKASGDQGVDLVLRRGTVEIAVQAKGYAESVGNDAVQAVHTGMTYYGCHRCAVVTNSTFTRAARELADSVGCRLIDGSGIPDLIHGRLDLMGFDSQIR